MKVIYGPRTSMRMKQLVKIAREKNAVLLVENDDTKRLLEKAYSDIAVRAYPDFDTIEESRRVVIEDLRDFLLAILGPRTAAIGVTPTEGRTLSPNSNALRDLLGALPGEAPKR